MEYLKKFFGSKLGFCLTVQMLVLVVLCHVHDLTKYKNCRSIVDLFYWPDGFCLDMVVIGAFMIDALLIVWENIYIFMRAMNESEPDEEEL